MASATAGTLQDKPRQNCVAHAMLRAPRHLRSKAAALCRGHGVWQSKSCQYEGQWKAPAGTQPLWACSCLPQEDQQDGHGRQTWSDGRVYEGARRLSQCYSSCEGLFPLCPSLPLRVRLWLSSLLLCLRGLRGPLYNLQATCILET